MQAFLRVPEIAIMMFQLYHFGITQKCRSINRIGCPTLGIVCTSGYNFSSRDACRECIDVIMFDQNNLDTDD